MHPSAAFLLWLFAVCLLPFLSLPALAVLGGVLLLGGAQRRWWRFLVRARWLLLSLWLIMAYALPGETPADLPWLPTWPGIDEANRQLARLVLTLGALAVLMQRLGRDELVLAVWHLLKPLARCGVAVDRVVVRLSLVLRYVEQPAMHGAWRRVLHDEAPGGEADEVLHFADLPWSTVDTGKLAFFSCLLLAGLLI